MTVSRIALTFAFRVPSRVFSTAFLAAAAAFVPATWKPWGRWATLGLGLTAMLVGSGDSADGGEVVVRAGAYAIAECGQRRRRRE